MGVYFSYEIVVQVVELFFHELQFFQKKSRFLWLNTNFIEKKTSSAEKDRIDPKDTEFDRKRPNLIENHRNLSNEGEISRNSPNSAEIVKNHSKCSQHSAIARKQFDMNFCIVSFFFSHLYRAYWQ